MKYFEIQDSPELKYAPRLKDWFGRFDVRDICPLGFPKLPERELFFIEPSENTLFTDIILFPFLLISPMVLDVIKMYREVCFHREIILLDQQSGLSKIYYLPVFDETRSVFLVEKQYKNGISLSELPPLGNSKRIHTDRNIFWVRDTKKRHIVISLDMVESLIRRNVTGLGLREVMLYQTGGEGNERGQNRCSSI